MFLLYYRSRAASHDDQKRTFDDTDTTQSGQRKIIRFYRSNDPWFELTNYYMGCPFRYNGVVYKTVEHYYQAEKFTDAAFRQKIIDAPLPNDAKSLGQSRQHQIRPDWEQVKDDVMRTALELKFKNPKCRDILLATGDAVLEEASPTDTYWGTAKKKNGDPGDSRLGQLLMERREKIRQQTRHP
jgi:ribA/ribD-fused uncharacterized protein